MRKGFIFSYELCVGCKACSAACMLENGWSFRSRNIYSSNPGCFTPDPVISLSMACNHCNDPACLKGCPSGAFSKDVVTGAVIIDPDKCLGCRYCIWNCPYDAPKFNGQEGIIGKCHFCYHRIEENAEPACSSACPTGALGFGEIPQTISHEKYSWIPEKNIDPSLIITGSDKYDGPVIIPERRLPEPAYKKDISEKEPMEWSLAGFTFLIILSVALNASYLFREKPENGFFDISLIALAAMFSMFHLGKKVNAWRAMANLINSPLSREIALFLTYSAMVVLNEFVKFQYSGIITFITGISLVLLIDSVYYFSIGRRNFEIHSGQALLTVMLMVSFILNMVFAFIFVAIIKGVLIILKINGEKRKDIFVFRFIRLSFLIITAMVLVRGTDSGPVAIMIIFFSGELADRIIFYLDFKPLNIRRTILYKTN